MRQQARAGRFIDGLLTTRGSVSMLFHALRMCCNILPNTCHRTNRCLGASPPLANHSPIPSIYCAISKPYRNVKLSKVFKAKKGRCFQRRNHVRALGDQPTAEVPQEEKIWDVCGATGHIVLKVFPFFGQPFQQT